MGDSPQRTQRAQEKTTEKKKGRPLQKAAATEAESTQGKRKVIGCTVTSTLGEILITRRVVMRNRAVYALIAGMLLLAGCGKSNTNSTQSATPQQAPAPTPSNQTATPQQSQAPAAARVPVPAHSRDSRLEPVPAWEPARVPVLDRESVSPPAPAFVAASPSGSKARAPAAA